jgi:hypothetical protein
MKMNGKRANKDEKGSFKFDKLDCYEGEFIYDKRNGHGVYTSASGHKYEGDFINDER